jgi:hypothetical protein
MIWLSIRNRDITRTIRDYLWKSIHGALKIGSYWTNIPGYEDRGSCTHCGELETMDHIQARCEYPGRAQVWELMNLLWTKRHPTPFEPNAGLMMGCGTAIFTKDDKPMAEKNRLYRILVSESAFLIWKLRNERAIGDRTHCSIQTNRRGG